MRLAGPVLEGISALILAYAPKHKQLLVKSPEQENMVWLIDIDCGEELIRKDRAFIRISVLADAIQAGTLVLKEPTVGKESFFVTDVFAKIHEDEFIHVGHGQLRTTYRDLGNLCLVASKGLDTKSPMIFVDGVVYNYARITANSTKSENDYSFQGLVQFVQHINEKYASEDRCLILRIKGFKFMQLFFDDICVLKSGENIADVGYEEVGRRIAHVAERT